jgi:hypothetical protein
MPRRNKPYFGLGSPAPDAQLDTSRVSQTIVDGARRHVSDAGDVSVSPSTNAAPFDYDGTRQRLAAVVSSFPELAAVQDPVQLVEDLTAAIGATVTSGLDLLVRGARTKPSEWDKSNLLRSLATVMAQHGLPVKVSDYEGRAGEGRKQSVYLRVVKEVARAGRISLPGDLKGLALRALYSKT